MGPVVDAALTAVMVLTPTAMYIGLWRLLMKMRDDDLVNRLDQRMKHAERGDVGTPAAVGMPALQPSDLDPELDGQLARKMERKGRTSQCPHCRTLNSPRDDACLACGADLEGSGSSGLLSRLER